MYSLVDDQRYQTGAKIEDLKQGTLWYGADLSLSRTVLLYQTHFVTDEELIKGVRNTEGFNHPNFVHILDICKNSHGLLTVLELREGATLAKSATIKPFSFDECLDITLKIGKLIEVALGERIHDFSISSDNLWYTDEKQLMIMNFWTRGAEQHRGAKGLFHLLYQLLIRSIAIPNTVEGLRASLPSLKQAHSLAAQDAELIDQLYEAAFVQCRSSFSFTLLLSQLINSRIHTVEPAIVAPVKEARTVTVEKQKNRLQPLWHQVDRLKNIDIKKTRDKLPPRKWLISGVAVILLLIFIPLMFFGGKGEEASTNNQTEISDSDSPPKDIPEFIIDPEDDYASTNDTEDSNDEDEVDEEEESGGAVTVPSLIGLSQYEAEQEAMRVGLRYKYYLEPHEQTPGTVFQQDLEVGSDVSNGDRITFWISKGIPQ